MAFLLAACNGRDVKGEESLAYFNSHRTNFERVVRAIDVCRPRDYRFAIEGPASVCLRSAVDIETVLTAARSADIVFLYYSTDGHIDDAATNLTEVHLFVFTSGLVTGGVMTSYVYTVAPQDWSESFETESDGIATWRRRPMTAPPIHWYWERLVR